MKQLLLSTELFFKNTFPHQDKIELNFHAKNVQKRAQMKNIDLWIDLLLTLCS
jgi:hypothetical protein